MASCLLSYTDDHSRVVLSHLDGHLRSDYINASYIDVNLTYWDIYYGWGQIIINANGLLLMQGFKEKNKFIAAQGKCVI